MALSKIGSAGLASGIVLPIVITPTNTSPANGAIDQAETTTLTGSTFYALYGYTHAKSQWQVSTSSSFGTTVVSTGDVDNLESYTISSGVLSTSTTYYWRVRYKDSNGDYSDWSTGTSFTTAATFQYSIDFLVVAGGAGGGFNYHTVSTGGGGGAGGYRYFTSQALTPGTAYTVTVGGGGAGAPNTSTNGGQGSDSAFLSYTSAGGGYGATNQQAGGAGGSGGGASGPYTPGSFAGGAGNTPATSPVQGYAGGSATQYGAGGGGGAGGVGGDSSTGTGGVGVANSITGSSVTYATGGGSGGAGTANTGNGGARGAGGANNPGYAGGSGVVILRMLTANYSGTTTGSPTVTTDGSYTVVKFTASGSYTA